jgi:hypothetical protein
MGHSADGFSLAQITWANQIGLEARPARAGSPRPKLGTPWRATAEPPKFDSLLAASGVGMAARATRRGGGPIGGALRRRAHQTVAPHGGVLRQRRAGDGRRDQWSRGGAEVVGEGLHFGEELMKSAVGAVRG